MKGRRGDTEVSPWVFLGFLFVALAILGYPVVCGKELGLENSTVCFLNEMNFIEEEQVATTTTLFETTNSSNSTV